MTSTQKIPATVITGFLGAGKTSMIRHLLMHANGRRIALIINEFGELGVDGEILRGCGIEDCDEDAVVELTNGCLCCTVADDFIPTIQQLLDRDLPPDHIVIETSGLALPKPLVKAFNWPDIRTKVTVDGVVTVVDADAVRTGLFAPDPQQVQAQREADDALEHESPLEELFEEQLGCADLVILNKADLLRSRDDSNSVLDTVRRELRPGVKVVEASYGQVPPEVLLGLDAAAESDLASRPSHVDNGEDHDHDEFTSFDIELPSMTSPEPLIAQLLETIKQHDILRVKGFAAVDGKPMRLLVQGVGDRIQHYFDREWLPSESRVTRLVIIGEAGIDENAIRAALQS
ncbi:MAG: cobalamin biosynthesis protein CobW [Gammaproteobacteria bacterium]|nr:cobalamin biosynthesis protein CobW [Gammaproteobacteria bacterium]